MNKEKLYMDIDYLFAWRNYEFHMKDGSVFVAYCEQDGGIRWKLKYYIGTSERKCRPVYITSIRNKNRNAGFSSISIKNEDLEYILDLGRTDLFDFESSDTEEDLCF